MPGAVLVAVRAQGASWALRLLVEAGADDCFVDVPEGGLGEVALARIRRLSDERASAGLCATRLERSEERFRFHAIATNDSIYDWDWVEDLIAWNDHHEAIEHVERAWHWWRSRVHPQDRARVVSAFRDMLKGEEELWRQEFRFRNRSGGYAHMSDRAFFLRDDRRKVVRIVGAMSDVSAHRESEEALRVLNEALERRVEERTAQLNRQVEERMRIEREIVQVGESERRSIGQDLHDGLCQRLAGVLCMAQTLHARVQRQGDPAVTKIGEIADELAAAIEEAREISRGLSPLQFGARDLLPALGTLASQVESMFRVRCRFAEDFSLPLPDDEVSHHLYRIAQEAISNAVRHGRAKTVEVSLAKHDDGLELRVTNDGLPLPPGAASGPGLGLRVMAYRADIVGGQFSIRPGSRGGAEVVCLVPFTAGRIRIPNREGRRA